MNLSTEQAREFINKIPMLSFLSKKRDDTSPQVSERMQLSIIADSLTNASNNLVKIFNMIKTFVDESKKYETAQKYADLENVRESASGTRLQAVSSIARRASTKPGDFIKELFSNPLLTGALATLVFKFLPDDIKKNLSDYANKMLVAVGVSEENVKDFNKAVKYAGIGLMTYLGVKVASTILGAAITVVDAALGLVAVLKKAGINRRGAMGLGAVVAGAGIMGADFFFKKKDEMVKMLEDEGLLERETGIKAPGVSATGESMGTPAPSTSNLPSASISADMAADQKRRLGEKYDLNAQTYYDLVGAKESGMAGYDAIFGFSRPGGDPAIKEKYGKNLSELTIGQALEIGQSRMSKNAGALGRYQFMPGVLKDLLEPAGLTKSDLFSPENQDKLMTAYTDMNATVLRNRGVGVTYENLIIAHTVGAGGLSQLLKAEKSNPNMNALDVLLPMLPDSASTKDKERRIYARRTNSHLNKPVSEVLKTMREQARKRDGTYNYATPQNGVSSMTGAANSTNAVPTPPAQATPSSNVSPSATPSSLSPTGALVEESKDRFPKAPTSVGGNLTPTKAATMTGAALRDQSESNIIDEVRPRGGEPIVIKTSSTENAKTGTAASQQPSIPSPMGDRSSISYGLFHTTAA